MFMTSGYFVDIYGMQIKKLSSFLKEAKKEGVPFEDLPQFAKSKALARYSDINIDNNWWAHIIEGFVEDMWEMYGVETSTEDIQFTGFYSQGDGASFTGKVREVKKFLEKALNRSDDEYLDMGKKKQENEDLLDLLSDLGSLGYDTRERLRPEDIEIEFERSSSNYSHSNTVRADVNIYDTPESWDTDKKFNWVEYEGWRDSFERECTKWLRSECMELYRKLEDEYEELQDVPAVIETLIANEYLFDEEGKIVN